MKTRRFRVTSYIELPFDYSNHWTEEQLASYIERMLFKDATLKAHDVDVEASKQPLPEIHEDPSQEDITSFVSPAGYIAPDGKFYGMESKDCGLCHLAIADEVYEYYSSIMDMNTSSTHMSAEAYLEDSGFIKVRGYEILYSTDFDTKPIYWTDEQKETVVRFMKHVETEYGLNVRFHDYGVVKSYELSQMDKFAIIKKFDWFANRLL